MEPAVLGFEQKGGNHLNTVDSKAGCECIAAKPSHVVSVHISVTTDGSDMAAYSGSRCKEEKDRACGFSEEPS